MKVVHLAGPSRKESPKQRIYASLREAIISNKLKPGEPLFEDELAKRYQVSRTPIREVLHRLEQDGLVKIISAKGTYVSELTREEMEELFELREALETMAVKLAANKISNSDIKELDDILAIMEKAVQKQDIYLGFEADNRLHQLILRVAGNNKIRKIMENLFGQIHRIRFLSQMIASRLAKAAEEHTKIILALKKRDARGAEKAMREHIRNFRENIINLLVNHI